MGENGNSGFTLDLSKLSFSLPGLSFPQVKEKLPAEEQPEEEKPSIRVTHRYGHRHISRKAASEAALSDQLDWHFREGDCYHCFSFGDVDSLTFFKHVLRQQRVHYLALSTWCMAGEDVDDLRQWRRRGMLGRVDFYVGEIFPGSYPEVYDAVLDFLPECGGRLCVFRNHSKIMMVVGERFDCLIESSANVNTNPRSENTVITVDRQLVADYIELFNGIKSFDHATYDVPPYQIPERR
ncbi:MAG: hypothetical protein J6S60_10405 [Oscillospiraceae bacterium]|nr:hypothetical protein [Oscillospiraceae bacterium]